ncbi:MAG: DUF1833 family protein [Dinoroseobacter sp.]|nr:DUF1833 family protein [Dinoroseobacter sp.]
MSLTPQSRLERAQDEIRQHRPVGLMEVVTLTFEHVSFDTPAYVVADNADLEAVLEDGTLVTFQAVAFTHAGPTQGEGRWPQIDLSIDNAATILEPYLELALSHDSPVQLTAREYIRERAFEGPSRIIRKLELDKTEANDLTVTATAGFFGLDRKFGTTYDPSKYPGIS